jgi:hypothetical protein
MSKFRENGCLKKKKYSRVQKLFLRVSFEATASGERKITLDTSDYRILTPNSEQLFQTLGRDGGSI